MGDFSDYHDEPWVDIEHRQREAKSRAGIWVTRARREIHITQMDADHLRNTLCFLARKAVTEMVELEDDAGFSPSWEEFAPPIFPLMVAEFVRRGYEIAWLHFYAKNFWGGGR
jgi:uncharacterized protein involved in tellurium resistance